MVQPGTYPLARQDIRAAEPGVQILPRCPFFWVTLFFFALTLLAPLPPRCWSHMPSSLSISRSQCAACLRSNGKTINNKKQLAMKGAVEGYQLNGRAIFAQSRSPRRASTTHTTPPPTPIEHSPIDNIASPGATRRRQGVERAKTLVIFANSIKTSMAIKYLAIDHTKK